MPQPEKFDVVRAPDHGGRPEPALRPSRGKSHGGHTVSPSRLVDDRVVADTRRPLALYESGFAPRWYVSRDDIAPPALAPVEGQTFCPYKGLASYFDVGARKRAAWSYLEAWPEVIAVSGWVSFEPDLVDVFLDEGKLVLEPGQTVAAHGIDRGLDPDELRQRR